MLLRRTKREGTRAALAPGDAAVPRGMQIAGAWAWRFVAVAAAAAIVVWLIVVFRIVVIPLLVAALITTALLPLVEALVRARWPRGLAVALSVVGLIVAVEQADKSFALFFTDENFVSSLTQPFRIVVGKYVGIAFIIGVPLRLGPCASFQF